MKFTELETGLIAIIVILVAFSFVTLFTAKYQLEKTLDRLARCQQTNQSYRTGLCESGKPCSVVKLEKDE